jgi:hypothetical protein
MQRRPEMRLWQAAHQRARYFGSTRFMIDPRRTMSSPAAIVTMNGVEVCRSSALFILHARRPAGTESSVGSAFGSYAAVCRTNVVSVSR